MSFGPEETNEIVESVVRLSKDLRKASAVMTEQEARFLVDGYYLLQDNRIRVDGQLRSMEGEPAELLTWLSKQSHILEGQIKNALDRYSASHPIGPWLRSVVGIGPVLASGYMAHINMDMAPTAGHILTLAGMDPTDKWYGKAVIEKELKAIHGSDKGEITLDEIIQLAEVLEHDPKRMLRRASGDTMTFAEVRKRLSRRPWNTSLKVITWKTGESFVKQQSRDGCIYGQLYAQRKALETHKNEKLEYADQAARILREKNFSRSTDAYAAYSQGKLPPAHIHARAKRWAVKIFISNLHEVWYKEKYKKPAPAPYPFAYLGHVHKIEPNAVELATQPR